MKKLNTVLALILVFAVYVSAQQKKQLTIAINDLKGTSVDPAVVSMISERLRSELINTGVFLVMERSEMQSILKEQGFQQSGVCDESSCLVEVGQLLGVSRMVAGSVGSVGNFWTISLRMFSVETGVILFTVNEDYEGDIKGVISVATPSVAAKLVAGAGGLIKQAALAGKTGDLYIESSESGAKLEIDGKAINGVTPLSLKQFPAGDHEIIVRKGVHSGSQMITLKPDIQLKIKIPMQADYGSIKVFSEPAGATVYLIPTSMKVTSQMEQGGPREMGKTPYESDSIKPDEYFLLLRKKGFSDSYQKKVLINSNQTFSLNDTLVKACRYGALVYGLSSLKASSFSFKENGMFNLEYQNIQWKTISHQGIEISPVCFYTPPKGMNSFMISDVIGISVDQNECLSSKVIKVDKLTNITTDTLIKSGSLKMNRLCLNVKMPVGYRFMVYPLALEPYVAVDFRIFNLVRLRGSLLDTADFWIMPNMRIAFPVGAHMFLYSSRRQALILGFEYNADMTFVKLSNNLDYDEKLRKNIDGGFSKENVNTFRFILGATF